jgi:outer membrane protein assembly factor BamC
VAAAAPASGAASGAAATVAAAPAGPAHARLLTGQPAAALQVDEPFDRAWRRVGLSLDRTGFTVEDRDRANGIYYVRYADPKQAGKEEPNFFSKLFGGDKGAGAPQRYRIQVQRGGTENTTVSVLNPQGQPDNSDNAKQIISLLVEDLK